MVFASLIVQSDTCDRVRRGPLLRGFAGLLALLVVADVAMAQNAASVPWPIELRQHMRTVNGIEYRLRTALGTECAQRTPALGLALDHLGAYRGADRATVAARTGLTAALTVIGVAGSSPAQQAGLGDGDILLTVNGAAFAGGADAKAANDSMDPVTDALARLDAAAEAGAVELGVRRGDKVMTVSVVPQRLCGVQLVVVTKNAVSAYTDGKHIALTVGLLRFAASDDEVALIAGHEQAHAVLGHGREGSHAALRAMEDVADLQGARMAACAGYDMQRAIGFWQRFGTPGIPDIFGLGVHRSSTQRHRRLRDEMSRFDLANCPHRQD